jgi:hypothetical protein
LSFAQQQSTPIPHHDAPTRCAESGTFLNARTAGLVDRIEPLSPFPGAIRRAKSRRKPADLSRSTGIGHAAVHPNGVTAASPQASHLPAGFASTNRANLQASAAKNAMRQFRRLRLRQLGASDAGPIKGRRLGLNNALAPRACASYGDARSSAAA